MKLSELLKQDTITLEDGSYLVAFTEKTGWLSSHRGVPNTRGLDNGQYLFKINKTDDGYSVYPMETDKDHTSIEEVDSPIVLVNGNKVTYITGRNHPDFRDAYNGPEVYTYDIKTGDPEHHVLLAFIEYANSEFSLGVSDFQIAPPGFLSGEAPDNGDGGDDNGDGDGEDGGEDTTP